MIKTDKAIPGASKAIKVNNSVEVMMLEVSF